MAPDVNVLIAAYREDHQHHPTSRGWLSDAIASCREGGSIEILPMVAAGFLRIVTNPQIFPKGPATAGQAVAFLRSLLGVPGVRMPELGSEWRLFEKLCVDLELAGTQVPDAWIAAATSSGGFHLVTFDAGFRRLLRPSEFTLLRSGMHVLERQARYTVHRPRRLAA